MSADAAPTSGVLVVGEVIPDLILRGDVMPRFGLAEQLLPDAILTIGGSRAQEAVAAQLEGRLPIRTEPSRSHDQH